MDLALEGVLVWPVPTSVKSDTPSSRAFRGVATLRAMLDLGESRCEDFEFDLAKCEDRFPPYTDLPDGRHASRLDDCLSGVKGEELLRGTVVAAVR